ncbi:MAG: hypothetical protein B5766_04820 [Candidatus Lumbricidophila eiseniae]|uniref:Glycosyltransferase 2-like domain-containing protein n=1 Tax=Candidatus Lumbricidiphila eiseniae TaxID=1969409 RepID=A0A2A6FST6_9MICO|nr:MAG: hypothetical protein B5766_04820 [Candidatus Lumbricidophila eiseniae]
MDASESVRAAATTAPRAATVSVALCTHNGERFVAQQVRSILTQTHPVVQIVVSDDASTDETVAVVERCVAEHRTAGGAIDLVVLRNKIALGVTANFQQALRATSGELVALSDQDDVWHPDRIARAVAVSVSRPGIELVAGDARVVDSAGHPVGATLFESLGVNRDVQHRLGTENALDELLKRNLLTGATMLVTRSLIDRAGQMPTSWLHDEWLAIVAATSAGIAVCSEPLIDYRQHGGNQIGVEQLGVRGKIGRLRMPRTARNARLLNRARDLARQLPTAAVGQRSGCSEASTGVPDPMAAGRPVGGATDRGLEELGSVLAEKLAHEQVRSALPRHRLARIVPVWREWQTGRYARFGLGAQDIFRDLVQPD